MMKEFSVRAVFVSLWAVAAIILVAMMAQNASGRSGKIYNISVLMRSPSDRFTKGMDQAALEFNADLHILSGYADAQSQLEYLDREIAATDAVVMFPEDPALAQDYLDQLRQRPPLITAMQPLGGRQSAHVGPDDEALGRTLGEWIAQDENEVCLILEPEEVMPYHAKRKDALADALTSAGLACVIGQAAPNPESVKAASKSFTLIAVIDESLLVPLCEVATVNSALYGIGYDSYARQYLESGRLSGLAVYSEYDAGYLSLRAAVLAAEGKNTESVMLSALRANASNMYQEPIVNILFPIG
ncbi:MAG: substrate-binding domain-containing protein [Clostridiales bacterium]|jgi:ribose transport system substrate-binding protein|nr:substrate-binding domain-containing protein [Clostridiales bacterium]